MKSNCFFFAVRLWFRQWAKARKAKRQFNDSLIWRLSRIDYGFVHVLYGRHSKLTGQIRILSYKPVAVKKTGFAPIFTGHVVRGDK